MVLAGCHRSVAPVKDADVAGLVPSWCATSHRRQRRRRHQPRRRRQATLGFDRPQDSNATGVPDDSATPLVSESVLGVFLGSPAATPRLESETPVAFDLRSAHATRRVRHKMYLGHKYKFNSRTFSQLGVSLGKHSEWRRCAMRHTNHQHFDEQPFFSRR